MSDEPVTYHAGMFSTVYIVEYVWYDCCRLLSVFNDGHTAVAFATAEQVVKEHGAKSIIVRELGVRTRLQFGKPHERVIFSDARWKVAPCTVPKLKPECTLPPPGWYCTREPGHEGPCAALPTESRESGT